MTDILPKTTRLRYVIFKKHEDIEAYLNALGVRIQIYGAPVWDGKAWTLWFVPNDRGGDIPSIDLRTI